MKLHRAKFEGPETNLSELITKIDGEQKTRAQRRGKIMQPLWQLAMQGVRLPLYDVHWTPAVVLEKKLGEGGSLSVKVGLADGRIMPLTMPEGISRRSLGIYDVVFVKVTEGKTKNDTRAELRVRPKVQGAALVLENKTGRVLAMVGGFSYPLSQLNRVTQGYRQPGSSIKPLTYLTALHKKAATQYARDGFARSRCRRSRARATIIGRRRTTTARAGARSRCGAGWRTPRISSRHGCSTAESIGIR